MEGILDITGWARGIQDSTRGGGDPVWPCARTRKRTDFCQPDSITYQEKPTVEPEAPEEGEWCPPQPGKNRLLD